jgi:hypothetical protein
VVWLWHILRDNSWGKQWGKGFTKQQSSCTWSQNYPNSRDWMVLLQASPWNKRPHLSTLLTLQSTINTSSLLRGRKYWRGSFFHLVPKKDSAMIHTATHTIRKTSYQNQVWLGDKSVYNVDLIASMVTRTCVRLQHKCSFCFKFSCYPKIKFLNEKKMRNIQISTWLTTLNSTKKIRILIISR